jgi:DNA-binding MarR family transcriptional regulator
MVERISFLLYRNAITATALADDMLRPLELTARAVGILTLVVEREPMTQRALGASIGVDRSTMVILLDDLEGKGLVTRVRHPDDRRAFLIEPTEAGRSAQRRALELLDRCEERYLGVLSPREQGQLRDLLARLYTRSGPGPD